jgi:hypothetical protein
LLTAAVECSDSVNLLFLKGDVEVAALEFGIMDGFGDIARYACAADG